MVILAATTQSTDNSGIAEQFAAIQQFYDTAFTQVLWIIGLALVIVGVIVPIVVTFIQNRQMKINQEEVAKKIHRDHEESMQYLNRQYKDREKQVNETIEAKHEELKQELKKETAAAEAGVFFVQGRILTEHNNWRGALRSLLHSAELQLSGESGSNLRVTLELIQKSASKLDKTDFDTLEDQGTEIDKFLVSLVKYDRENHFNREIQALRREFREMSTRVR